jgi:protein-tyrosine phosphatase
MTRPTLYAMPVSPPGRLSTMARPRGGDWLDDEMASLRELGVGLIVCLLTAEERGELELTDAGPAAERAGIEFVHFPVPDFGVPDHAQVQPLLERLHQRLAEGDYVAVHCRGGVGRSSVVAGAVLAGQGVSAEDAWAMVSRARGVQVPETAEQRQWLADHIRLASG